MHPDFHDEPEVMNIKPNAIMPDELTKEHWMEEGMKFIERQLSKYPNTRKAKNILFFLGDGMSHATIGNFNLIIHNLPGFKTFKIKFI